MIYQGILRRGIGPTANKIIPSHFIGSPIVDNKTTIKVTYHANGATGGEVPSDSMEYKEGEEATIIGNTGTLIRSGYVFVGWKLFPDN